MVNKQVVHECLARFPSKSSQEKSQGLFVSERVIVLIWPSSEIVYYEFSVRLLGKLKLREKLIQRHKKVNTIIGAEAYHESDRSLLLRQGHYSRWQAWCKKQSRIDLRLWDSITAWEVYRYK